jgi:hypothetical protein
MTWPIPAIIPTEVELYTIEQKLEHGESLDICEVWMLLRAVRSLLGKVAAA